LSEFAKELTTNMAKTNQTPIIKGLNFKYDFMFFNKTGSDEKTSVKYYMKNIML